MNFRRTTIAILLLLLLMASNLSVHILPAQERDSKPFVPDPAQQYSAVTRNPVTYDVDFSIVVTPPYKTKVLRVWLPIPVSDVAQQVDSSELSSFPAVVEPVISEEPVYGNRFAYFEFHSPLGAQMIRHRFRIRCSELHWNVDPQKVIQVRDWPASFDRYRQTDTQAVVVDDRFRNLLTEIVPAPANASNDLTSVMKWVHRNFEYDHQDASLQARSEHAFEKHRGHCSDYHSFCASMGRAMGVPTRVTYGINTFPKSSPSHCKLEAFLAPYGWVSFDVSETQKLVAQIRTQNNLTDDQKQQLVLKAEQRLANGFRDNTWFLQTRGTDYELAPPASRRVPVVRTAYIEADGVALPEPDPADKTQTRFAWMTIHDYRPDRPVTYPFTDLESLKDQ